ncbi:hypothetical protein BMF94_6491 [Rhodotorula taiwanensis]|uniref:Zn(2)-C6 fungal-type domain-containing protein n=1 Tax=Rhodotorula taiwanensis TaxID=741276 RepID=A0A2S5B1D8_9BASI|nr:hypothetical protein BMF94_6491 [Rhodotorula taiwanensis]
MPRPDATVTRSNPATASVTRPHRVCEPCFKRKVLCDLVRPTCGACTRYSRNTPRHRCSYGAHTVPSEPRQLTASPFNPDDFTLPRTRSGAKVLQEIQEGTPEPVEPSPSPEVPEMETDEPARLVEQMAQTSLDSETGERRFELPLPPVFRPMHFPSFPRDLPDVHSPSASPRPPQIDAHSPLYIPTAPAFDAPETPPHQYYPRQGQLAWAPPRSPPGFASVAATHEPYLPMDAFPGEPSAPFTPLPPGPWRTFPSPSPEAAVPSLPSSPEAAHASSLWYSSTSVNPHHVSPSPAPLDIPQMARYGPNSGHAMGWQFYPSSYP